MTQKKQKTSNIFSKILKYFLGPLFFGIGVYCFWPAVATYASGYILKEPAVLEGVISDNQGDEIIVWNGKIKLNITVQNIGTHIFVSNNNIIPDYENFSYIRTYFQDKNGKIFSDVKRDFPNPVYSKKENNSDIIPLTIEIPKDLSEGRLIIEVFCKNSLFRRCNSHIEKIQHKYKKNDSGPFKILVVDAAGKSHIKVSNLRKSLEDTLGESFILKAAWSEEVFSKQAFGGALLYYNSTNHHSDISPLAKLIQKLVLDTYSHLEGKIKIAEINSKTMDWSRKYLSDCAPDYCENNSNWLNLDLYSNRFSPRILEKNPDIDIIVFLPY